MPCKATPKTWEGDKVVHIQSLLQAVLAGDEMMRFGA